MNYHAAFKELKELISLQIIWFYGFESIASKQLILWFLGGWEIELTSSPRAHFPFKTPFSIYNGPMIRSWWLAVLPLRPVWSLWRKHDAGPSCTHTSNAPSTSVNHRTWWRRAITSSGNLFRAMEPWTYPPMLPSCTITVSASSAVMTASRHSRRSTERPISTESGSPRMSTRRGWNCAPSAHFRSSIRSQRWHRESKPARLASRSGSEKPSSRSCGTLAILPVHLKSRGPISTTTAVLSFLKLS